MDEDLALRKIGRRPNQHGGGSRRRNQNERHCKEQPPPFDDIQIIGGLQQVRAVLLERTVEIVFKINLLQHASSGTRLVRTAKRVKTLFCKLSQPAIDLSNDFSIEIA
ncbi:hypothetical protein [Bradyrhizobium sp. AZCC 2230]|uniref:hypothetical protein n=1 Tax=Bradyrhizobium sp. AZCC 2230 TaxID=3117021 RepID=UPI002FF1CF4F